MVQTKHIFVTGGVASSLGKGLTASSLGHLLRARGLRVTMQKLDPYLNVDPGTMNPFQHGEVFVTEDGAETDLDIGHYERFLDSNLHGMANVTTGQVYSQVIARERRGEYLGDTVQVIPHITNEIKERMRAEAAGSPLAPTNEPAPDVIITEIGGTVGDIESLPFLEAARQVRHDVGRDNVFFLHVSLVPYLAPSGELKTKPTQHSVAALRQVGIQPDGLVLRADREIPDGHQAQDLAHVRRRHRGRAPPPSTPRASTTSPRCCTPRASTPTSSAASGCTSATSTGTTGTTLLRRVHDPEHSVEIALVGKYIDLPDAYLSVTEAMRAGGFHHDAKVNIRWVASDECQTEAGRPEGARRRRRGARARRLRRPRHRGQARGAEVGPRAPGPDAGHLPGPAVHGHRVRAQRRRHRGRVVDRVRPGDPRPGHRDHGGAEGLRRGRRRPRRHDAARAPTPPA